MPIARISLRAGKLQAFRQAIFDGIYRSMRETLNVPEDDQFMTITEHDPANFRYGNAYGVNPQRRCRLHPNHRVQHPHPFDRRRGCTGGSWSCLVKTRASGRRTCS